MQKKSRNNEVWILLIMQQTKFQFQGQPNNFLEKFFVSTCRALTINPFINHFLPMPAVAVFKPLSLGSLFDCSTREY
jgi:hypothetical protein